MDPNDQIEIDEQISAEACSWVAQMETGNLSRADLAALREWVARSPAHANEINAIAKLSGSMQVLTECLEHLESGKNNSLRKKTVFQPAFLAVVATLVISSCVFMFLYRSEQPQFDVASLTTQKGEFQSLTLSDGSIIEANTDSEIRVEYSKTARKVKLLRGEALFDVAHVPNRPFIVEAGDFRSEALGTSFSIKLNDKHTELSVVDGVVSFSRIGSELESEGREQAPTKLVLNAGQSISSSGENLNEKPLSVSQISILTPKDISRRLSWTEGLLEFSDTPLNEVVSEVNRYVDVPISISDIELNNMQIGGIYRAGDMAGMLEAFERLGIEVDRSNPKKIILKTKSTVPLVE
ncbi:FecR family protein [Hirschia maritima]|uniref:FecR family protein n=1 Tax=Hirschia maritima TaxID=1121961 RepID=UPI00037F5DCC|nr:FecR domain-containing protein [Hirschia maritima]